MGGAPKLRGAALAGLLLLVAGPSGAPAQPPPSTGEPAGSSSPGGDPSEGQAEAALRAPPGALERARQVRAFLRGDLDPAVDPAELCRLDLASPLLEEVLRRLEATPANTTAEAEAEGEAEASRPPRAGRGARRAGRAREPEPPAEAEPDAELDADPFEALAAALTDLLRLSDEERAGLFRRHRARQAAAASTEREQRKWTRRRDRARRAADRLAAYLDGRLDPSIDPSTVITVNLSDRRDLGLVPERRARVFASTGGGAGEGTPADPGTDGGRAGPDGGEAAGDATGDGPPRPSEPPRSESATEGDGPAAGAARGEPARGEETAGGIAGGTPSARALADLVAEVNAAEARLDALRRRYLGLTPEERAGLAEVHREAREAPARPPSTAVTEAQARVEAAARERAEALEQARRAETEALRIRAAEEARLRGIQEAQARLGAEMAARRDALDEDREQALRWVRRVGELDARSILDPTREGDADRLYRDLVDALGVERDRLHGALDRIVRGAEPVPGPDPGPDLPPEVEGRTLERLSSALRIEKDRLGRDARELAWEEATVLRDGIVAMNQARLRLLALASPAEQQAIRGFGAEGSRQARRELQQIELEVRYHLLALPRVARRRVADLWASPLPLAFGLLQLVLLVAVFRWWRRHAEALLESVRLSWERARPETWLTRGVATVLWYVERARGPLEWLLFAAALFQILGLLGELPELRYVWIVIQWLLLGGLAVRLLDAAASRDRAYGTTAKLRLRSLRLIGVAVIGVGLILGLTAESVGRGAIYAWVSGTAWFLTIPVAVLLVLWWRPTVLRLAKHHRSPPPVLAWVAAQQSGVASYPAAAVGGVYLLGDGLYRSALRRLADLPATKGLVTYLSRRELERRAQVEAETPASTRLSRAAYARLDPEGPSDQLVLSVAEPTLKLLRGRLGGSGPRRITAVVGERGLGKSTLLRRLVTTSPDDADLVTAACPVGGDLDRALREALALPADAGRDAIVDALRDRAPALVILDDVHRTVRPAVGGLAGLDRLLALASDVGGATSWVLAFGAEAFQHVRQVRAERATFDEVLFLAPWSPAQVVELTRLRSRAADLAPRYDGLVVPRQLGSSSYRTGRYHTERDFCRLLSDYANGNPAVALHFFRESLVERAGTVFVRLFQSPSAAPLDDLPASVAYVLRALHQLEVAREEDVVACTELRAAEVADALRLARSRGYVEPVDGSIRLSLHWYRAVDFALQRRHLLP